AFLTAGGLGELVFWVRTPGRRRFRLPLGRSLLLLLDLQGADEALLGRPLRLDPVPTLVDVDGLARGGSLVLGLGLREQSERKQEGHDGRAERSQKGEARHALGVGRAPVGGSVRSPEWGDSSGRRV